MLVFRNFFSSTSINKGNAIAELDATAGHGDPSRSKLGSSSSFSSVLLHDRSCSGDSDVPEAKALARKSDFHERTRKCRYV